MIQVIRDYAEGLRKGLAIVIECRGCGKRVHYRASDFRDHIRPSADIEQLKWRCSWCDTPATYVRWSTIDRNDRERLAQWTPPVR